MKINIYIINVKIKVFYRKDIKTRSKPKHKEKIELMFAVYQKQVKDFPVEKCWHMMMSAKNFTSFLFFFFAFWKAFKLVIVW